MTWTGPGNTIQTAFGGYPGYISQLFNDSDRAEFPDWVVDGFYFRNRDHKGFLVPADLQGTSPEVFKARNRKGDGKLTPIECLNTLFQDFAAIDVNQTGEITVEEIEAYIERGQK